MHDHYLTLLRSLLEAYKDCGLELVELYPPPLGEEECLARGLSFLGVARLKLRGEELLYRFPYPTARGTFILRGREYGPTLKALRVGEEDEDRSPDLARFQIWPAELARVRAVLNDLRPKRTGQGRPPSPPSAVELEGRLNLIFFPHLLPLDRTNPLAEVADRRKVFFPGGAHAPLEWRAVHESHRGKLCPLETPETEDIGLRRFLAREARLVPCGGKGLTIEAGGAMLGLSLSLVPFLQHSDGARAMMGGKNWKQALPLLEPETPLVKTGWERRVAEASGRPVVAKADGKVEEVTDREVVVRRPDGQKDRYPLIPLHPSDAGTPLGHRVRVRVGDSVRAGRVLADWPGILDGELAVGRNVLVAYLPFFGYTFEDGIVVSASLARKFTSRHLYEFVLELRPGEAFTADAPVAERHRLTPAGVIRKGVKVTRGELLARKRRADGELEDLRYDKFFPGRVIKAEIRGDRAVVWVEADRPLEVGDKLTGRHGNKGVVAKILPDAEMPFFRVGDREYRVEAILSPMGVVSRMNLGQLLETHYGWVAKAGLLRDPTVGDPFREVDIDELRRLLKKAGLPEGKAELFLRRNGREVPLGRAVVGYQYLAKLNHLARDKFHVRLGEGQGERYAVVTEQPVKGKRLGGGQRLGEMEVWALLAHGAFGILEELLTAKSDDLGGRRMLRLAFDPRGRLPLEGLLPGFPETLRALRYFLRGLGLELEFLEDDGGGLKRVRLRRATRDEILGWSNGEVRQIKDLEDEAIFGKTREEHRERMGHIELAMPLPHPLFIEGGEDEPKKGESIKKWQERFEGLLKQGQPLTLIPVIPRAYRPDPDEGSHHLNRLYREVILANLALKRAMKGPQASQLSQKLYQLYQAVKRLFLDGYERPRVYSLLGHLEGKRGLLRRFLLGKRQDFSGRAVIVPDPELSLDECGIPLAMAVPLLSGALRQRLQADGITGTDEVITRALQGSRPEREQVKAALERVIREHDLLVLLNRQPTLHKYNLLAFRPRIRDDFAIAIPPLVCGGFNADFDGDTMALYLPLTRRAQEEAKRLLPSRHLFKAANGDLILHLTQDFVLGAFLLSQDPAGRKALAKVLGGPVGGNLPKKELIRRVAGLVRSKPPGEVMEKLRKLQALAFKAATTGEASFSFFDIQAIALPVKDRSRLIKEFRKKGTFTQLRQHLQQQGMDENEVRRRVVEEAERRLEEIESAVWNGLKRHPQNPFARYFLSGARGDKKQLRQIAGLIGYVFGEDGSPMDRLLTGCFVEGLSEDDYWALCHSTRRTLLDKKLGVAEAGALTRDLVEGAYEVTIVAGDCRTSEGITFRREIFGDKFEWAVKGRVMVDGTVLDESVLVNIRTDSIVLRSPLTCRAEGGICWRCYGLDRSTGEWPPIGSPVGVLAGQSVGEQGTQLSMRTFHTGGLALPIGEVGRLLAQGKLTEKKTLNDVYNECGAQGLLDEVIPRMLATYKEAIAPIHFEVLLRAMLREGGVKGLREVALDWRRRGVLAAASYREPRRILREAVEAGTGAEDCLTSPKARVMVGRAPRKAIEEEPDGSKAEADTGTRAGAKTEAYD
jgi:DNA-directed RNA polymerase beta' subunit